MDYAHTKKTRKFTGVLTRTIWKPPENRWFIFPHIEAKLNQSFWHGYSRGWCGLRLEYWRLWAYSKLDHFIILLVHWKGRKLFFFVLEAVKARTHTEASCAAVLCRYLCFKYSWGPLSFLILPYSSVPARAKREHEEKRSISLHAIKNSDIFIWWAVPTVIQVQGYRFTLHRHEKFWNVLDLEVYKVVFFSFFSRAVHNSYWIDWSKMDKSEDFWS